MVALDPYGEALADNCLRERNNLLWGCDHVPRRREDSLNHPDHCLDSGDNGLSEREDLRDRGDDFPGHSENGLRRCDHCLRPPEICLRRSDICLRRSDICRSR